MYKATCVPDELIQMTQAQLSMELLLINIVKTDRKTTDNVMDGDVIVKRWNLLSGKNEKRVFHNVTHVKKRVITYQMLKGEDYLARLRKVLNSGDLFGKSRNIWK